MRMNKLGNSDLIVSTVGAGTWAMGGDFFGAPLSPRGSFRQKP